jgi:hypothetical protein
MCSRRAAESAQKDLIDYEFFSIESLRKKPTALKEVLNHYCSARKRQVGWWFNYDAN